MIGQPDQRVVEGLVRDDQRFEIVGFGGGSHFVAMGAQRVKGRAAFKYHGARP